MSAGPDGHIEREQWAGEEREREYDELDRMERDADESRDDLEIQAEVRMLSWAIDRVLG